MTISKIDIHKLSDDEKYIYGLKCIGLATVTFDCNFVVTDIKIMTGEKGEYLVFPIDKSGIRLAFPIKEKFRQYILNEILKELGEINNENN